MSPALAKLFHKIHYTYKLWEFLLSQVGYYSGSLELAAGMNNQFEYYMCGVPHQFHALSQCPSWHLGIQQVH